MANNELSGPVVVSALFQYLLRHQGSLKYSYRLLLLPETIGSIAYLSENIETLKANVLAGFQVSCVGDNRAYSYMSSRYGNTLADRVAKEVLSDLDKAGAGPVNHYDYLARGSDERQYCAPHVDLPLCGLCRSKYGEYPEYHTSADNFDVVSAEGLQGGLDYLWRCIVKMETSIIPDVNCHCEPQLGKRGLYPSLSQKSNAREVSAMMNVIAFCDGTNRLEDIAKLTRLEPAHVHSVVNLLLDGKLVDAL